jgi:hypothetical protein
MTSKFGRSTATASANYCRTDVFNFSYTVLAVARGIGGGGGLTPQLL